MRVFLGLLLSCALLATGGPAFAGEGDIAAMKRKANEIAGQLSKARGRVASLNEDIKSLEAQSAEIAARHAKLKKAVSDMAVSSYINGGNSIGSTSTKGDINETARVDALSKIVTRDSQDMMDVYRKTSEDLDRSREALSSAKQDADQALGEVKKRSKQIESELARLQALAAKRKAEEAARKERERKANAQASKARLAANPGSAGPSKIVAGDGWLCPVQGAVAFSNDWGDPRSGGRRHQGTDIMAARGTPIVASVSGTVRPHNSAKGGISYYLAGDDGNTYFGTHLSSLSGAGGRVERGTVVGYVGNSGNASGGPNHLHFEIHPGGGAPVNPYPTVAKYC